MENLDSTYIYIQNQFEDFDALAEAIRAWDLDFRQLDRGQSPATLSQLIGSDIVISHACFSRHYHQQGSTPTNMRTFAVLEENVTSVNWFGREFDSSSIACFPTNGELEAVSKPDFEVYTLSLSEELLDKAAETLELPKIDTILCNQDKLTRCNPYTVHSIRLVLRKIQHESQRHLYQINRETFRNALEIELPQLILKALAESQDIIQTKPAQWKKRQALDKANEYLNAFSNDPLTVQKLCEYTQVSNRTLEHAFKDYFGITPKNYLKAVRLNGARKDLLNEVSRNRSITDIANHWGFWHMGQFAADYNKQFGELPSITIKNLIFS